MDGEFLPRKRRSKKQLRKRCSRRSRKYIGSALHKYNLARAKKAKRKGTKRKTKRKVKRRLKRDRYGHPIHFRNGRRVRYR